MIYTIETKSTDPKTILSTTLIEAFALAFCMIGKQKEAEAVVPFKKTVRKLRKELKANNGHIVLKADMDLETEILGSLPALEVKISEANTSEASEILDFEYGLVY